MNPELRERKDLREQRDEWVQFSFVFAISSVVRVCFHSHLECRDLKVIIKRYFFCMMKHEKSILSFEKVWKRNNVTTFSQTINYALRDHHHSIVIRGLHVKIFFCALKRCIFFFVTFYDFVFFVFFSFFFPEKYIFQVLYVILYNFRTQNIFEK